MDINNRGNNFSLSAENTNGYELWSFLSVSDFD